MKGCKRVSSAFVAAVGSGYWRQREAEVVLAEWASSGLELEEFAGRHELSPSRLRRWSARLGHRKVPRLYPVELRFDGGLMAVPSDGDGGVELVLRGGRRVVVRREFEEELLARVVSVVESWSC